MDSSRTTTSGQGLTLITGLGGRPVDRTEVETWCRTRNAEGPREQGGARREPALVPV